VFLYTDFNSHLATRLLPRSINQSNQITNQILFAQNTSHLYAANEQVVKAIDEQGQQGSKEHLQ